MGGHHAGGAVSNFSFDSHSASDLESDFPSGVASSALAGSVLIVRGCSIKHREAHSGENSLKYLPLGIQEIITHEDDKMNVSLAVDSSLWVQPDNQQKRRPHLKKRPYKREAINKAMASALKKGIERRDVILNSLKLLGVTSFIIDSQHATAIPEIMEHLARVVAFVGKENRTFAPTVFQRCLLYQDKEGMLYNLMLPQYSAGLASKWQEYVDGFSAFQATLAFAILARSLPCVEEGEIQSQLKPAYLALIVGLVLVQETSLSWTNVVMMVQACPSMSAYSVTEDLGSDWIRKSVVLLLAFAGPATGKAQVVLSIMGILFTCAVLLANLGARAWYFFQWQPLSYSGSLSSLVAYMTAVVTGFALPFLGQRIASVGGKPAIECIVRQALLVAFVFTISDFKSVQSFLIVGVKECNQDGVNAFVGVWLSLSLLASTFIAGKVEPISDYPDEEPLLEEDHRSPVGFRVPNLPDFPIDPCLGKQGMRRVSVRIELCTGVCVAALIGAGIVSLSFTDWGGATEAMLDFF